jgi:hypothetical protein
MSGYVSRCDACGWSPWDKCDMTVPSWALTNADFDAFAEVEHFMETGCRGSLVAAV